MRVIAVAGRKGGVGKTTIAVHVASVLAERGQSVVLVDADTQGSATHWASPGSLPMTVKALPVTTDKVSDWVRTIRNLQADTVVIDCAPHLDAAMGAAVSLATIVVVPCGPSSLDLMTLGDVLKVVKTVRARRAGKPPVVFVPNRIDRRTAESHEIVEQLERFGEIVAPALPDRVAFVRAFISGDIVHDPDVTALVDFLETVDG